MWNDDYINPFIAVFYDFRADYGHKLFMVLRIFSGTF